jgi:hypothetical protein
MPLVHVSLRAGKPQAYRQAIFDNIYLAMRETFNVPEDDQFMTMTEHEASNFRYSPTYMDVARSDDLSTSRSRRTTRAAWNRRRRCSSGSRSAWAKIPACGPRTCS